MYNITSYLHHLVNIVVGRENGISRSDEQRTAMLMRNVLWMVERLLRPRPYSQKEHFVVYALLVNPLTYFSSLFGCCRFSRYDLYFRRPGAAIVPHIFANKRSEKEVVFNWFCFRIGEPRLGGTRQRNSSGTIRIGDVQYFIHRYISSIALQGV